MSKFTILVLAILTIVTFSFQEAKPEITAKQGATLELNASYTSPEITYVRVFKDGIWWIYVYQDGIVIDYYPED